MKKIIFLLLLSTALRAQTTYTPNLSLQLPPRGSLNWDTAMNTNFTTLDAFAGNMQSLFRGAWSSSTGYARGQQVTYSGVLYQSSTDGNLNNVPSLISIYWTPIIAAVPSSVAGNTVYAGPDGSGGAPAFRGLAVSDLPSLFAGLTSSQGNGTKLQRSTGTPVANNCAKFDANGNIIDAGSACSTVSGHNLLSSSHTDTTPATVSRGALVTGQGATPSWSILNLGSTGKVLKSNGTDILWSTLAAAGIGTCTNQFVTGLNADAAPTCTTDTLASAQHANQGTVTTVLHGNGAGNPSWSAVSLTADVTGVLPSGNGGTGVTQAQGNGEKIQLSTGTAVSGNCVEFDANGNTIDSGGPCTGGVAELHNLLSGQHPDTSPAAPARGALITGQGTTPLWTLLGLGAANRYPKSNGTDIVYSTLAAAGTGTCTNQFITGLNADASPSCTTDTLASAQHANQGTATQVLHGNAAGNPSWSAVSLSADVTGTLPDAGLASSYSGVGFCTNTFVTGLTRNGSPTCTTDTLASAQHANQGTTTTVLHGNAAGNPTWSQIVDGDILPAYSGTGTCTNQFVTGLTRAGAPTCTTATLTGPQFTGQGTANTFLHGGGAGALSWSSVNLGTDVTGNLAQSRGGTGATVLKFQKFGQTCTTPATLGGLCTIDYTWATPFADTNYIPVCTGINPTNGTALLSINLYTATYIQIILGTGTQGLASYYTGVACFAIHP